MPSSPHLLRLRLRLNRVSGMYICLQPMFSFCETAESKNKIHAFDTTVVRGCGMYEKLVNLYKMKSVVMFRNFIAKKAVWRTSQISLFT